MYLESAAPASVVPPRQRQSARGVLFTLNAAEQRLFFPDGFNQTDLDILAQSENDPRAFRELVRSENPRAVVTSWSTPALDEETPEEAPALRYICHTSGSVRQLVPRSFIERGILVTNWGILAAQAVAEHALLLILAGLRRLPEWRPVIDGELQWQPSPIVTRTLFDKRVGLHGFGNVARALADLLRPFGVAVSAFSEGVPPEHFAAHGVERKESLESLFTGCDVLVECEALTPRTHGCVTEALLRRLPEGTLFVNVGRGAVVDEEALASLANQGRLKLALDVFATDPIAPDSPLHRVKNALLSPHIAGPASDQFTRCGELALRNLRAFFDGRPLQALVTLEIYDRAT